MEIKSTLKTLMGFGEKENAIPMELKSTMNSLMGFGIRENTIPMEMESTLKTLMGEIIDNRPKGCEGKVVEIDGKKYRLTEFTS